MAEERVVETGLSVDSAALLDTPDYDGAFARAAALVHTLGRCRCRCRCRRLERSNFTVACAVAVMYLEAADIPVNSTREQLTALAHELNNPLQHRTGRLLPAHPETLTLDRTPPVTRLRAAIRARPRPPVRLKAGDGAADGFRVAAFGFLARPGCSAAVTVDLTLLPRVAYRGQEVTEVTSPRVCGLLALLGKLRHFADRDSLR